MQGYYTTGSYHLQNKPVKQLIDDGHSAVRTVNPRIIGPNEHGQRVDNFLIKNLKGVPRTRIYKAVRSGEVRVNGSRIKVSHKLMEGDKVRIPPLRVSPGKDSAAIPPKLMERIPVLFEDDCLLVVDKPSGLAVHGGSGLPYGLIEAVRHLRPELSFVELAHRLDRETSGCLMLAKSRKALLAIQSQLSVERTAGKTYLALVEGNWHTKDRKIDFPLSRFIEADTKKVKVDANGHNAVSVVSTLAQYITATLVRLQLETGRMHQARVHCAAAGHPIAADRMYGNRDFNRIMKKLGLGRLFLHARTLSVVHPDSGRTLSFDAPLPQPLNDVLERLENQTLEPATDRKILSSS